MKQILFCLLFLTVCGSSESISALAALAPDETKITTQSIFQPLNRFLLIRRGEIVSAVIFTSFKKRADGDFTLNRSYQNFPSGWQLIKEDSIGMRQLKWWESALGMVGIHTPPLSRIKPLELKDITLMALASPDGQHAIVCFGRSTAELDGTIELAPTPWRKIEEVNLADARLKWYRAYGPELTVKINELWK